VVVYPKLEKTIKVHEVKFDIDKIISACRTSIENIETAVARKTPEVLDMCPEFAIKSCDFASCSCRKEIIKGR